MAHKAGYVNIIGEPNTGKSTLVNALLGERLMAVNPKAQTTRHRILGLLNGEDHQVVLSDTPGILDPRYALQKTMMHAVDEALEDADVLLVMTHTERTPEQSAIVVQKAARVSCPVIVLVNKIDLADQARVGQVLAAWQRALPQAEVLPVSALHGFHIDELRERLIGMMPEHPAYFPKDELSDRDTRFFVSEIVREQVLQHYHQELPYSTQVVVTEFKEEAGLVRIVAEVIVMRESQKAIVLGREGRALRTLGTGARKAIERFLQRKVFLRFVVKVDPDWRDDGKRLAHYGYR